MLPRYRSLAVLVAASLAVGTALRAVLWWEFGTLDGVGATELPSVLARGLVNDLVVALFAFTPLALYLALATPRWLRSRAHRVLIGAGAWGTLFALVFLAVVERYFFQEFDARFNLVAFDYLAYPTEVAGDIWAEYPVVATTLAAAAIASAGLLVLRRWLAIPPRSGAGA